MNNKIQPYALYEDNFQRYGANSPLDVWEADPVQCAIDGPDGVNKLFTCSRNATRIPLGFNEAFMAQRCAANWDGYCDLYGKQQHDADFTRKKFTTFIRDCLSRMFCQNDTSIPGAQCIERCEMFNPMSSSSVEVCQTQGDLVFRTSEKRFNLSTDFPQSGQLKTAEPIRFTKCPKICNLITADKLTDANVPLNIALDQGIAQDLIENLVENIVSQKLQHLVTNQRLKNFMKLYVQDGSVKVGFASVGSGPYVTDRPVATPAVNPFIPPQEVLMVDDPRRSIRMVVPGGKQQENFGFIDLGGEEGSNAAVIVILIVAFLAGAYFLNKSKE